MIAFRPELFKTILFFAIGFGILKPVSAFTNNNNSITFDVSKDLQANNILELKQTSTGKLWIATLKGVYVFDGKSFIKFESKNEIYNCPVNAIIEDKNHIVWIGTQGKGLFSIDGLTSNKYDINNGLSNEFINSLCSDTSGNIWIATNNGLNKWDGKSFHQFLKKDGLPGDSILKVAADSKGGVWIVSNYGLSYYSKNKFVNYTNSNDLPDNLIHAICIDKQDQLWFSSKQNLSVLKGNKFINYEYSENLANAYIKSIMQDHSGIIWFITNKNDIGNFNNGKFELIEKKPDFSNNIINSFIEDREGIFWYATQNGLLKFIPESLKNELIFPLISIDNVQLFLKNINWHERNDSLDKTTGLPSRLILTHNENHVSFSYNAIYLTAPDNVVYSYMLKGFDNDWLPSTAHTEAIYPNLPPGEYLFKVKASADGKNWSLPTTFFLKIAAPWWKNPISFAVYFIVGLCAIYLLLKLRTHNLEKSKNLLSLKIIERTRELNAINIELSKLSLVASETDNVVLIFDKDLILEYANAGFTKLTGFGIDEIIHLKGKSIYEITYHENFETILQAALHDRKSKIYETRMVKKDGEVIWTSATLTPIFDNDGKLKNIVVIDTDITLLKKISEQLNNALEERGVLLKEIHHRVKNNLQIIISLFNLQSNYITDAGALKALKEGQDRIKSMALIHERFYQSEGLSKIDFDDYIKRLAENLFLSYNISQEKIKLRINADKVALDIDTAVPCGLIVNELISNALKHAFTDGEEGEVVISFENLSDTYCRLIIGDNGVGLSNDFDFENSDTLGTLLVKALTDQIEGKLSYENKNGLKFTIDFKKHI